MKILGEGTPYVTIPRKLGIEKDDEVEITIKLLKKGKKEVKN